MLRSRLGHLSVGLIVAVAGLLSTAAPSEAALLTASATDCTVSSTSQVFAPWGDMGNYGQVPGGSFEAQASPWTLTGGAAEVVGNESFFVNSATDDQSLSLPAGSSATSPTFCVDVNDPTIRFFAMNSRDPASSLTVDVNFVGPLGLPLSLPVATITAGSTWEPTSVLPMVANLLTLLPGNSTPVSLSFVPNGSAGAWQIDDVYVDPFGRS